MRRNPGTASPWADVRRPTRESHKSAQRSKVSLRFSCQLKNNSVCPKRLQEAPAEKTAGAPCFFSVIVTETGAEPALHSEGEFQRHFYVARRIGLARYRAKRGAAKRHARAAELRMVEEVQRLEDVLQTHAFPNYGKRKFFGHRHIRVAHARRTDPGQGPRRGANGIWRGVAEASRGGEKMAHPIRAGISRGRADQIRTLGAVSRNALPAVQARRQRPAAVEAPDPIDPPAAEEGVQHGIPVVAQLPSAAERQLVHVADLEDVGHVVQRYGILQPAIVGILQRTPTGIPGV